MDILWHSFEILVNLFENALICYFIQKHFPGRFSQCANRLINLITVLIIAGIYTAYLYFPPPWIVESIILILFWLLYTVIFRKGYLFAIPGMERCSRTSAHGLITIRGLCSLTGSTVCEGS